ncbi:MAG: DUF2281 domain-containing protein [Magnetococcus sp. YQC-5]
MALIDVHEADGHLDELIKKAMLGEEVVLSEGKRHLVKLVPINSDKPPRQPGSAKGKIRYISADFDEPLADFKDYMP